MYITIDRDKLARRLGVSLPAAIGHLHLLWWWAMDYAQDGDLTRWQDVGETGVFALTDEQYFASGLANATLSMLSSSRSRSTAKKAATPTAPMAMNVPRQPSTGMSHCTGPCATAWPPGWRRTGRRKMGKANGPSWATPHTRCPAPTPRR